MLLTDWLTGSAQTTDFASTTQPDTQARLYMGALASQAIVKFIKHWNRYKNTNIEISMQGILSI